MTLRRKLLVQFFLLAVLPIAVFATVSTITAFRSARLGTEQRVQQAIATLATATTKALESELFYLSTLVEEAYDLGLRPAGVTSEGAEQFLRWVSYYRLPALTAEPMPRPSRLVMLEENTTQALTVEAPSNVSPILDLATMRSVQELPSPYLELASSREAMMTSRFLIGADARGPVIVVTARLPREADARLRCVAIEFALLEFFEPITESLEFLSLDAAFVAKPTGEPDAYKVLFHSDLTRIGTPLRQTGFPVEIVRAAGSESSIHEDERGFSATRWSTNVHGARVHSRSGLLLGASGSLGASFAPLRRGVILTWVFFALAAAVVTAGILLATRGVSGAVETIARGTDAIATGQFDHAIRVDRTDEFGAIAKRINDMGHELLLTAESRAITRISARLVHDLKGVVSQMNLLLYNLKINYDDPEFRAEFFGFMQDLIEQVENITRQLRRSEPPEPQLHDVDVNAVVRDVLDTAIVRSQPSLKVESDLGASGHVRTDSALLAEALQNVVMNAVEAMEGSGVLRIRTGITPASEPYTHFVEVGDDGPGMSQQFIENELFRPFATTKSSGSGLGMYGARQIIHSLKGRIQVHSEENNGTRVRFEIGERVHA